MGKHKDKFADDEFLVKNSDNCVENFIRFGEKGFVIGTLFAIAELHHLTPTTPISVLAGRSLVRYSLPAAGTGAIFASTTCLMDDMRGKDSPISNGFIGGLVAGAFFGARFHHPWRMFQWSLVGGVLGFATRGLAVGGPFRPDQELKLQTLNDTLDMSRVEHLRPQRG